MHDICTMTDRDGDAEEPQRKFIKLALLELEKVRRGKEKRRARERTRDLEKRLAEIEGEQAGLLAAVRVLHPAGCQPAVPAPHAAVRLGQNPTDLTITY